MWGEGKTDKKEKRGGKLARGWNEKSLFEKGFYKVRYKGKVLPGKK